MLASSVNKEMASANHKKSHFGSFNKGLAKNALVTPTDGTLARMTMFNTGQNQIVPESNSANDSSDNMMGSRSAYPMSLPESSSKRFHYVGLEDSPSNNHFTPYGGRPSAVPFKRHSRPSVVPLSKIASMKKKESLDLAPHQPLRPTLFLRDPTEEGPATPRMNGNATGQQDVRTRARIMTTFSLADPAEGNRDTLMGRASKFLKLDDPESGGGGEKSLAVESISITRGQQSPWVFKPSSRFLRSWDMLTCFLLLYAAIVTPYEVSFLSNSDIFWLFVVNAIVDLCFGVDIVLHFFMPYQDHHGAWITDHKMILSHYVFHNFYIDVISVFPFHMFGGNNLRVLRIVKLLRLTKLLRILRGGKMLQRWEASLALDYSVLCLIKNVSVVCAIAHWFACAWHLIIYLERSEGHNESVDGPQMNWLENYAFIEGGDSTYGKYMTSLYWALATLSTLGYGDVVPTTDVERTYVVLCTIIGASVYAYMVGAVCGIVASMDEKNTKFYQQMDALNGFMREKNISPDLRERLRDYFRFKRYNSVIADNHGLLEGMSPALRGEVSEQLHSKWINAVDFFVGAPADFYIDVALSLDVAIFCSREYVIRENELNLSLYITERGVVASRGRILTSGQCFGLDMLYSLQRRQYFALSLSHVVVLSLSRESLSYILESYPHMQRTIRRRVAYKSRHDTVMSYCQDILTVWKRAEEEKDLPEIPESLNPVRDMAFTHCFRLMQNYGDQDFFGRTLRAAETLQRVVRKYMSRRALKLVRETLTKTSTSARAMFYMLTELEMTDLQDMFVHEKIDIETLKRLTPADLRSAHPIALGDCIKLIDAAKTFNISVVDANADQVHGSMMEFYKSQVAHATTVVEKQAAEALLKIEEMKEAGPSGRESREGSNQGSEEHERSSSSEGVHSAAVRSNGAGAFNGPDLPSNGGDPPSPSNKPSQLNSNSRKGSVTVDDMLREQPSLVRMTGYALPPMQLTGTPSGGAPGGGGLGTTSGANILHLMDTIQDDGRGVSK